MDIDLDKMRIVDAIDVAFALGRQYWECSDSDKESDWAKVEGILERLNKLKSRNWPTEMFNP